MKNKEPKWLYAFPIIIGLIAIGAFLALFLL